MINLNNDMILIIVDDFVFILSNLNWDYDWDHENRLTYEQNEPKTIKIGGIIIYLLEYWK